MAITVKHNKVSLIPDAGDDSLIEPSDWNADHTLTGLGTMAEQDANAVAITGGTISGVTLPASNITGTLGVPNGGTGASTLTGYVKGTGTTAMTASATIPNTDITGLGTASTKDAGAANGVATLDAGGKVPVSELPAAVLGALSYQGTWDASTNTPTLTSSTGTKGYYYVVAVAGTTNLDGITDWQIGDWAVYSGTAWQKIDNSDIGGDVVGPASATDNAIARFDSTTGKLLQNSVVTVSDAGVIDGVTHMNNVDYIDFDTTYATTLGAGQLGWNGNDTLGLGMIGGNVIQHIGEDQFFYAKATATITKGQVVMFTGAVGASGVPTGAPATGITDGTYIMGIAAENIANNGFGLVQSFGTLRNVNTTGYADGDILWYNPAVAGGLTKTKPVAPNVKAQMAAVINGGSAGGGTILIRISAGSTLGGTDSNAEIGTPSNGQIITYDGLDGYWKNTDLTAGTAISVAESSTGVLTINNTGVTSAVAGTGISVSGATGAVTVTNTAPDQTVVLTAGTGISTSGTYPNFTVTNTAPDQTVSITGAGGASVSGTYPNFTITTPSGTVTSVTGTSPVVSSGGATPAISLAASYGDTQNPYASKTANFVLAAPNGSAGVPTFRAIVAADIPTLNQNTTGTASNVTGTVAIANGGTGATTAAAARTALGATTVGGNMFTLTNPSAITFPRFNADNTVSALDAATFRTAIGAGTGAGTVTSVGGTGTVNGITLTGTVTSSGNLTLGGTLSGVSLATQVTGTLPIANGGTGETTRQNAMDALAGAVTSGQYLRGNGTDVVMSAIQAADVPTLNQNTTGTASNVTGTVAIANGGTGQTTATAAFNALNPMTTTGDILYEASPTVAARLGIGSTGQVLTVSGGIPAWGNAVSSNITPNGMWENATTIAANYTIGTNNNAMSAGPITVNTGVTVTVPTGSTWTVV
jgi:hypothetical protein